MSRFKVRRCHVCGKGKVRMVARPGRRTIHRNLANLEVPADLAIPTCDNCGTEWFTPAIAKKIDAALDGAYREELRSRARTLIAEISEHVTQQRLEVLLDLAQGYLSKLRSGRSNPSASLVSELAMLAENPRRRLRELERYWGHEPTRKAG